MATLMFTSCLQMEEPASIVALRTAKAELISAEAQYKRAETAMLNAEVAYKEALYLLEMTQSQNASEILKYEHQIAILEKKAALARAEQEYADALLILAENAKGLTAGEEKVLDGYLEKLANIRVLSSDAQVKYENAVNAYYDAQYSFEFDVEVYKFKYLYDVKAAQKNLEIANEFKALLAEVKGSDYVAAVTKLEAEIKAEEEALKKLEEQINLYEKENKNGHLEKIDQLDNLTSENATKIYNLELQQKHLYMDNQLYYKREVLVPALLVEEMYNWFYNYNYLAYTTGFVVNPDNSITAVNNKVTVQFNFEDMTYYSVSDCLDELENGMMAKFLKKLVSLYVGYADIITYDEADLERQAVYVAAQGYQTAFNDAVSSAKSKALTLENQINQIVNSQLAVDLERSALKLAVDKVNVEVATKNKELNDRKDALSYVKQLKNAYMGFVNNTTVVYPKVNNSTSLENNNLLNNFDVVFVQGTLGQNSAATVAEVLEKWTDLAEAGVLYAQGAVTKAQKFYDTYCQSENPMVLAQQYEVEIAKMEVETAKMEYEYYSSEYELYSKLFNDFLTDVLATEEPVVPETKPEPTPEPTPEETPADKVE